MTNKKNDNHPLLHWFEAESRRDHCDEPMRPIMWMMETPYKHSKSHISVIALSTSLGKYHWYFGDDSGECSSLEEAKQEAEECYNLYDQGIKRALEEYGPKE